MTNQERFYQWLIRMGNIHTADNVRMERAFQIVK